MTLTLQFEPCGGINRCAGTPKVTGPPKHLEGLRLYILLRWRDQVHHNKFQGDRVLGRARLTIEPILYCPPSAVATRDTCRGGLVQPRF